MWISRKSSRESRALDQNLEAFPQARSYVSTVTASEATHMNQQIEKLIQVILRYQAASEYINVEELSSSASLQIKRFKDSVYWGEVVEGKREGLGVMLYLNGRVYEGGWEGNYRHKKGYEKFSNGSIYKGEYVQGKPEGCGRYEWENGELYEGEWKAGLKHGSGIWRGSKGDSYIGEWQEGKAEGYGVHTWTNGDRYEGEFKECLKHGEGVERFANGDSYKGNYEGGKPHGYGEYFWASGSFFKGNFKVGLRCGQGVWKRGPGLSDKYEGEWFNDKKEGYGVFTWADGSVYKGNFVNDLKDGYGEVEYNDGRIYKGQWKGDQQLEPTQDEMQHDEDCQLFLPSSKFYPDPQFEILPHAPPSHAELHNSKYQPNYFAESGDMPQPMPLYNQPKRPAILKSASRNYRQRNFTKPASRGEVRSRGGEVVPSQRSKSGLSKKMSVGTVMGKANPYQIMNDKAMSSSFFVYKMGQSRGREQAQTAQSQRRQIKSSGGTRGRWKESSMDEQLKYFTRNKIGSHSQLH